MRDNTSPQSDFFQPPKLAERILTLLLIPEDCETFLGDFAEICNQQSSQRQADSWYWKETFRSVPALMLVIPGISQSLGYMTPNNTMDSLYANAPYLEILRGPVVLLGGLLFAFILNLLPALSLRFERRPDGLTSVITFKPALLHWAFIGLSLLMVGTILIYAFFENFGPI